MVSRGQYVINGVNIRVEWPASLEVVEVIDINENVTNEMLKVQLEGRKYGYLEVRELRRKKNTAYALMKSEEG